MKLTLSITEAKGVYAVEDKAGSTAPQIIEIEHRIDDRRRVSRHRSSDATAFVEHAWRYDVKDVRQGVALFLSNSRDHPDKAGEAHSLRSQDVVCVAGHVCKLFLHRDVASAGRQQRWPKPTIKRKVIAGYHVVGGELWETGHAEPSGWRLSRTAWSIGIIRRVGDGGIPKQRIPSQTRSLGRRPWRVGVKICITEVRRNLVPYPNVSSSAKVARRAGLHSVAAHLHVPEEGFAKSDESSLIADNLCPERLKI